MSKFLNIDLLCCLTDSSETNFRSNFERFCSSTSLHGWKYLSSNNVNAALKIGWIAVVLGSMGVAGFFLGYSCNDFLASKVQTTQDTSRQVRDHHDVSDNYGKSIKLVTANSWWQIFTKMLLSACLQDNVFGRRHSR